MGQEGSQSTSNRKAIALAVALVGAALYVWLVVTLADWVVELHWAVELLYFALVGVAWAWPAARLLRWAFAAPPAGKATGG
ncbi:DUF2842 domain-containing protein [Elioraea thermophila]|uniref:DUF2842 domain-containing protein n=1 Tax=Elioraea thermophila TaxID=2185104 RepID=UPI00130078EF|nr:DUF2842 domain-containing protein [Elioraea thermophila]